MGTAEELEEMDREIEELKEHIAAAKAEHKALTATLSTLQSTLTTDDLYEAVQRLERTKKELLARLGPLRAGNASPVSAAEKASVDLAFRKAQRDAASRKKIFNEFWGMLCDSLPDGVSKDDLWVREFYDAPFLLHLSNARRCRQLTCL